METRNYTYPKAEKLKSHSVITKLFSDGKTVSKYPLRLVYITAENAEGVPLQMGVSVSKKHFKHAADRNYFKRVLRETYRHNKHMLIEKLDKPYAMMFFYQSRERLNYAEIEKKTVQLFEKFLVQEGLL